MSDTAFAQNYFVDHLTLSDLRTNGRIKVPPFQRGVVWTKNHRKEFIETVKMGDPFGVILVYQDPTDKHYDLIDGLQRLSALRAYMDNPLEFIDENDRFIDNDKVLKIFQKKYEIKHLQVPTESKLNKEKNAFLKNLLKELKKQTQIQKSSKVWEKACEFLGVDKSEFDVFSLFDDFYDDFIKSLALDDGIKIYAIVYQGQKDKLPAVFETLNTSSVSLTKYEVFSSQWPNSQIVINDEELVKKVYSKYETLKKSSSFDVDVTEDSIRENGMTLFEYCFGFSELLSDEVKPYSFLFSKSKKSTDPTGFELLALACGLSINKADDLYKDEYLGGSSGLFLKNLEEALIDSVSIVSDALSNWITDLKGTVIKVSSTYQVYYMIMSVFKHKYVINTTAKTIQENEDKDWIKNFKANAYKWYFYHFITGFWNINRQVSDLKNIIDGKTNTDVDYSLSISSDYWNNAITPYLDSSRDSLTTRSIPAELKLFLNYYYRFLIKEDANRRKFFEAKFDDNDTDPEHVIQFDIEHIIPFDKFSNFKGQIPMSVLGNLCYLAVKDNRSKRDNTIYDYAKDRPALTYNQDFLRTIDYPSREELNFINCPLDQFKTPYEDLVKRRETTMVQKFIKFITE